MKRRTPLPRSTKPLARKSRLKRKAGGTKHSRRPREWGYMAFCHARGCELARDTDTQAILGFSHDCSFERMEFAHLSDRKRYDVGDVGAVLCRAVHRGIDGDIGGKAPWYVALGRTGQKLIRERLANRARREWDALTDGLRAEWERIARARFAEGRTA